MSVSGAIVYPDEMNILLFTYQGGTTATIDIVSTAGYVAGQSITLSNMIWFNGTYTNISITSSTRITIDYTYSYSYNTSTGTIRYPRKWWKYTLTSQPSSVGIGIGSIVTISGTYSSVNTGNFEVISVNNTSPYSVTINNTSGTLDSGSGLIIPNQHFTIPPFDPPNSGYGLKDLTFTTSLNASKQTTNVTASVSNTIYSPENMTFIISETTTGKIIGNAGNDSTANTISTSSTSGTITINLHLLYVSPIAAGTVFIPNSFVAKTTSGIPTASIVYPGATITFATAPAQLSPSQTTYYVQSLGGAVNYYVGYSNLNLLTSPGGIAVSVVASASTLACTVPQIPLALSSNALTYTLNVGYKSNTEFLTYSINVVLYDGLSDFIFVNSRNAQTLVVLPIATQVSDQKAIFIKDIGWYAHQNTIIVVAIDGGRIDGKGSAFITAQGGCLSLFTDKSQYYIANNYPSSSTTFKGSQPPLGGPTGPISPNTSTYLYGKCGDSTTITNVYKKGNAFTNCLNVFNTDDTPIGQISSTARQTGPNLVTLPIPIVPCVCFVSYVGSSIATRGLTGGATGPSSNWNSLMFVSGDSNKIDGSNSIYSTTVCPQIFTTNNSSQSTGIMFISDGTTWYIAGWAWNGGITWNGSSTPNYYMPNDYSQFAFTISSNIAGSVALPSELTSTDDTGIAHPYFILTKNTNQNSINQITFSTSTTPVPNVFNNTSFSINPTITTNTSLSSFLFMSEQRPNEIFIRYYPIISYLPNDTTAY